MSKNLKVSNLGRTYGIHSQLWTLLAQIAFFFFNTICLPILAGFGAFIRSESLLGPQALG